jgi:small subunit ribosomal protein S2
MEQGGFEGRTKKEILMLTREKTKLEKTLGGIRDMAKVPSAVWIVDTKKEHIAVGEARKLGIPVVSILDTNCDPDEVDYPIPGNDDTIRSAALLTKVIARAAADGLMARSQRPWRGRRERCRRGRAARRVGAGAAHQRYRLGRGQPA